jgi:hypothetical protein
MFGLHHWHRHARTATTVGRTASTVESELALRLTREFREMPGLCLTLAQAARLCSADQVVTGRALEALVHGGVLWRDRRLYRAARAHRWCA